MMNSNNWFVVKCCEILNIIYNKHIFIKDHIDIAIGLKNYIK